MSKKPTIKISYPEASEKALKLTEAMVKRSPGKRVVETESEDPIFPDGGDLFSSFIHCKTSTGVDLTLTLNPASMDFALETLIRPNLNAEERKRILGESEDEEQAELGLGDGAQAAQAPGQALDGSSSPGVPSAEQEAATQSGEPETNMEAEAAIAALLAYITGRVRDKKYRDIIKYIEDMLMKWQHGENCLLDFSAIAIQYDRGLEISNQGGAPSDPDDLLERLLRKPDTEEENEEDDPSWDDVEKEARTIGQKEPQAPAQQSAAPLAEEPSAPAEKSPAPLADEDIEPGLLNDLETKEKTDE